MSGFSKPGNRHLALASVDLINVVCEKAATAVYLYFHLNFLEAPRVIFDVWKKPREGHLSWSWGRSTLAMETDQES